VCLAESIDKWVERMAVRGGWRPLSGLICEIVNSVGQGNVTFCQGKVMQGKVREFQTPMAVVTMKTYCDYFSVLCYYIRCKLNV